MIYLYVNQYLKVMKNIFAFENYLLMTFCMLCLFSGNVFSMSAKNVDSHWSPTKGCECGLGSSVVKNQSVGVLFSRTDNEGAPIGFPIDFSGVNRIAFQVDNVFLITLIIPCVLKRIVLIC